MCCISNNKLGIIGTTISNTGEVQAVKGQDNEITRIVLPAGQTFIVLSNAYSTVSLEGLMGIHVAILNGNASKFLSPSIVRTIIDSGGGAVIWSFIETKTESTFALYGHGYANANYKYRGSMCAIRLN